MSLKNDWKGADGVNRFVKDKPYSSCRIKATMSGEVLEMAYYVPIKRWNMSWVYRARITWFIVKRSLQILRTIFL